MLNPFSGEPSKWGPKMAVLGENGGRNLRFWFRDPQNALPCAEPRRLTYFASKSVHASRLIKCRLLSSVTNAKALDCVNFLCVTL